MVFKSCFIFVLISINISSYTQNFWTTAASFGGGVRDVTFYFTSYDKGFVGGGRNGLNTYNNLWEYDPLSDTWSQKSSYPIVGIIAPSVFTIGDTTFVVSGWQSSTGPAINQVWGYI